VSAIGIDAEPNDVLPGGVLDLISLEPERVMLAEFAALRGTCWDRLLFSAKEAVYKAWFPITGRWLDFKDAKITIDPAKGSFSAKILISGAKHEEGDPAGFTGNWLERDGLLMTAIAPLRYA